MTTATRSSHGDNLDPVQCDDCGEIHARCLAHKKRKKPSDPLRPCTNWPLKGSPRRKCRMHGGGANSRHGRVSALRAAQMEVQGEIGDLVERLGLDPADVNYSEVLARQVTHAHAMAFVLELEVRKLRRDQLYGPDHLGDARPHALMVMSLQWTTEAARLSKLAIDAGVDERQVRLAESMAGQMVEVLSTVITGLLGAVRRLLDQGGLTPASLAELERSEGPRLIRQAVEARVLGEEGMAS